MRDPAGPELARVIQLLARVPGLGPRSARRAALHLIKKRAQLLDPLTQALQVVRESLVVCRVCGNIDTEDPCRICQDDRRDPHILIVVQDVADLWALERAHALAARYHILGGVLSPLDGVRPEHLNLESLIARVGQGEIKEVLLALNATVDGQTTAHYIMDLLSPFSVRVTRLAHGVPIGGELDYLDEGTLAAAVRQRMAL
jgi:recombination protein RecR